MEYNEEFLKGCLRFYHNNKRFSFLDPYFATDQDEFNAYNARYVSLLFMCFTYIFSITSLLGMFCLGIDRKSSSLMILYPFLLVFALFVTLYFFKQDKKVKAINSELMRKYRASDKETKRDVDKQVSSYMKFGNYSTGRSLIFSLFVITFIWAFLLLLSTDYILAPDIFRFIIPISLFYFYHLIAKAGNEYIRQKIDKLNIKAN